MARMVITMIINHAKLAQPKTSETIPILNDALHIVKI